MKLRLKFLHCQKLFRTQKCLCKGLLHGWTAWQCSRSRFTTSTRPRTSTRTLDRSLGAQVDFFPIFQINLFYFIKTPSLFPLSIKGSVCKNEDYFPYRLTSKNIRWWLLLILLLSVASIRRKLIKIPKIVASIQIQKVAIFDWNRKKINLIHNKSFRYYNL